MRAKHLVVVVAAACGSNNQTQDAGHDGPALDAPESIPMLTSFVATPSQIPAGVATSITWTWTYATEPTIPDPACSIDNGVGPIIRGQATLVTLTQVTSFTLTCTNRQGSASKVVVVAVPPVAPILATFTATPALVVTNVATPVTWTWTYANIPSPAPACTVDFVGTITSNTQTTVTQAQARTYRLRCTNTQGTSSLLATVSVNECVDATAQCDAHATCNDTVDAYTCTCNAGYAGTGDVCSAVVACGVTPALCDAHATCVGTNSCVCNAGYVGDGTTCTRERYAFVTSTTGNGLLSSWTGAGANTGLAAADAVCTTRALAATLPGTYVAWMSDSNNDAYCRVHGLTGKKANNCGLGALPVSAGPWTRPNGTPLAPTIDKLLAPTHATFNPNSFNESNVEVTLGDRVYTGTDDNGVYVAGSTCGDWLTNAAASHGAMGEISGGGTSWTHNSATDPTCDQIGHLRCMEVGAGPALPPRHPAATKKAFLTSVSGTGDLSSWADASGLTGISAADAICQSRARYAGYLNAAVFKAWLSTGTNASSHILSNGPWARADGIVIAANKSVITSNGRLTAPLYQQETNAYASGNVDAGGVYTGSSQFGSSTFVYCNVWTSSAFTGTAGRFDLLDFRWSSFATVNCTTVQQLYCLEDQ